LLEDGPAGITAALYMCRAGYKTALLMGDGCFGSLGKISIIENYPGIKSISGFDLGIQMNSQLDEFEETGMLKRIYFIDAMYYEQIDNTVKVYLNDYEHILIGKTYIECIGGKHNTLGLNNESEYFGNGISFCATCDGPLYKDKNVVIVGGGNSAIDFALTLSNYCREVLIIHRRNEFRATPYMIDKIKTVKNISYELNTNIIEINKDTVRDTFCITINNNINTEVLTGVHGIFYALGFKSNKLENKSPNNIPNIFFAGDCIDEKYRQVITACGDGCKAALNAISFLQIS
jgi:alkyl hydroperoxide reductase subunit F